MKQTFLFTIGTLLISFITGCEKTDKPDACFTPSKTEANVFDLISFENCSTGADSYLWDFGDDSTSTEIAPVHSYSNPGQYAVKLTVTNKGGEDVTNSIIEITGPIACFTMLPNPATVLVPVNITNCSTGATHYGWDFDNDGIDDTDYENFSITFEQAGTYTIKLTAYSETASNSITKQLTVNEPGTFDPSNYNLAVTWVDHYVNEFNTEGDWTMGTTADYNNSLSGGIYTITNLNKEYSWLFGTTAATIPASTENYDIEISCKIGYDKLNSGDGLFWAMNTNGSAFYLYVLTIYQGVLRYTFGDANTSWIENWGAGGNVADYNKMTLRKYGNMYYIFLNEELVHTQNYTTDFGNDFGFIAGPDSQMLIDWIHIRKVSADSRKDGKLFTISNNSSTNTNNKAAKVSNDKGYQTKLKAPSLPVLQ